MTINVQFVYGAGNDMLFGQGITELRDEVISKYGEDVFVPRVIDHTEYETLKRLVGQWNDPTVLIGHSCGVQAITKVAVEHSMKPIPYMMGIATSIFCRPKRLPPNVAKLTEIIANSNFFNPLKKQLIFKSAINNFTEIEIIASGVGHVESAKNKITHDTALREIRSVIENHVPTYAGS